MNPTSLDDLLIAGNSVSFLKHGLRLLTNIAWVVKDETNLSYTTIIRLVECCREYHFRKDLAPHLVDMNIDTTCRCVDGQFFNPIEVNQTIDIIYIVKEVRNRGYSLHFSVFDTEHTIKYADVVLVLVFINILSKKPIAPPKNVLKSLKKLV